MEMKGLTLDAYFAEIGHLFGTKTADILIFDSHSVGIICVDYMRCGTALKLRQICEWLTFWPAVSI
jgi:hypothetical protein